ncbi:heterokaryon incompatibility protein-domain-containing protein [Xylariaceae sp. FL0804]|nr:heterokaryon incompatibility protein-domain-containing protein [Xylariaceae sp. FL0804]
MKNISVERKDPYIVHQHCPDRPYLELQVPADVKSVKSIDFTVWSRDQGFASIDEGWSFTWMDVVVRRPTNRSRLANYPVYANHRGKSDFNKHHRRWDERSDLAKKSWLAALLPEDVIQLIPRARFQAWVNLIKEARIVLGYQEIDKGGAGPLSGSRLGRVQYSRSLQDKPDEFRILVLEPAERLDDMITCELREAKLGGGQQFEAISYRWDDGTRTEDIRIRSRGGAAASAAAAAATDGSSHEVLPVAHSVARVLRQLRRPRKARSLWIDQLCIDQDNAEERAQQVRQMSRLYREAARVNIWLGEGDRMAAAAIRVARDVYNFFHPDQRGAVCAGGEEGPCRCEAGVTRHWFSRAELGRRLDSGSDRGVLGKVLQRAFEVHLKTWRPEVAQSTQGLQRTVSVSQLMASLFSNPWFYRAWVVQEALSARSALVHCGAEAIPWEEVVFISRYLAGAQFANSQAQTTPVVTMPPLWNDLDRDRHMPILDVFLRSLDLQATQPQDKLFALLPFGRETCRAERIPPLLQPRYTDADGPECVMADFTRWWIREYRSLDILSWTHCQPDRTWVRTRHDSRALPKPPPPRPSWALGAEGSRTWGRASLVANEGRYSATKDSQPNLELIDQHQQQQHQQQPSSSSRLRIQLQGYRVDEIREITYLALGPVAEEEICGAAPRALLQAFDRTFDPTAHFKFWNTWWTEPSDDGRRPAHRIQKRFYETADGLGDHLRAHKGYFEQKPVEAYSFESLARKGNRLEKVMTETCPDCLDPFFFVGAAGWKGLCPWPAKKGDVIVLLRGGKVPYLLRPVVGEAVGGPGPQEQVFEFVGECFAMDLMMGGPYERRVNKGEKPSTFTLV